MRDLQDRCFDWHQGHFPETTLVEQAEKVVEEANELLQALKDLESDSRALQAQPNSFSLLSAVNERGPRRVDNEIGDVAISLANLQSLYDGETLTHTWRRRFNEVVKRSRERVRRDFRKGDNE